MKTRLIATMLGPIAVCASAMAGVSSLAPAEVTRITNHLMPLPQELKIEKTVRVPAERVSIRQAGKPDDVTRNAVRQLQAVLDKAAGGHVDEAPGVEIIIGTLDEAGTLGGTAVAGAERLGLLKNKEQAYVIRPEGENSLMIAALTSRGVYYGVMTVIQLLEAGNDSANVSLPLATITDWPDFADRGYWHMKLSTVPWFSSLKLNYYDSSGRLRLREDKTLEVVSTSATVKGWPLDKACGQAERYAVKFVPGVRHLDLWAVSPELLAGKGDRKRMKRGYQHTTTPGFTETYPELLGKGDRARRFDRYQGLCFSQPKLVDILADLMRQVAGLGARETTVWASEYPGIQCQCADCLAAGQLQLEVKAALEAWERVRKQYPAFGLKIFYGRGGKPMRGPEMRLYPDKAMKEIIHMLPGEVALCASGGTGMWLPEYAKLGGRINQWGVGAQPRYWDIFNLHTYHLMPRHLERGYYAVCQFTPGPWLYDDKATEIGFQVCLLAECSWNVGGRTPREFATAYATRNGIDPPERFAEFAETMSGVNQQIVGTFIASRGAWLAGVIDSRPGQERVSLMRTYDPDSCADALETCMTAVELAQKIAPREYLHYANAVLQCYRMEGLAEAYRQAATEEKRRRELRRSLVRSARAFVEAYRARLAFREQENRRFVTYHQRMADDIQKAVNALDKP